MSNTITTRSLGKPVCIVTGGSYGIGDAVCEKFIDQGYAVINLDIKANPTQSKAIGWLKCDVSVSSEVSQIWGEMNSDRTLRCLRKLARPGVQIVGVILRMIFLPYPRKQI